MAKHSLQTVDSGKNNQPHLGETQVVDYVLGSATLGSAQQPQPFIPSVHTSGGTRGRSPRRKANRLLALIVPQSFVEHEYRTIISSIYRIAQQTRYTVVLWVTDGVQLKRGHLKQMQSRMVEGAIVLSCSHHLVNILNKQNVPHIALNPRGEHMHLTPPEVDARINCLFQQIAV